MEQSPHVMMIGEGAENFAFARGMERVSPEIFSTPLRYEQLLAARKEGATVLDHSGAPLDENRKWAPWGRGVGFRRQFGGSHVHRRNDQ